MMPESFARMLSDEQRPEFDSLLVLVLRMTASEFDTDGKVMLARALFNRMNEIIQAASLAKASKPAARKRGAKGD